ncbi:MAG: Fis family transcriptional regulator [Marmoricola sp.]|nr:Fis family transcriptional regulator [Marmoricola sp.]
MSERARLQRSLGGEDVPVVLEHLPDRLQASWRRSEDYGVPLESFEPVFTGTLPPDSLFHECGQEVLGALHRTLSSEPVSMMLTDAEGLVLDRLSGDHALLRALDRVHLAPGFAYSERHAGTNGLGLALADRAPAVVRAEQHYSLSLCTYTCAAVPVIDPRTGRLEGAVNLTTWSDSSSDLLLALAQSAASNTSALMLTRSGGLRARPTPRGEVFRVVPPRLEPGSGTTADLGHTWTTALRQVREALGRGRLVAVVGECGSGRTTLLSQAERLHRPRGRILAASPPEPQDVDTWLSLWLPEVGKQHTAVIARDVDLLPVRVAQQIADHLGRTPTHPADPGVAAGPEVPLCLTATRFEDIPAPLAALVDTVVPLPPLRERPDDVAVLARHLARRTRGRDLDLTSAAQHVLENHAWPGNVAELLDVVRDAARRTDTIDVRHLPPALLTGSTRKLSRIESFERDEVVRVLTQEGVTMAAAAEELGMSRATIYRKLAQLDIHLPR